MALGVSVRIELVDKLSRGLGKINERFARLEKAGKRANREFIAFGKTLDRFGQRARGVGSKMTLGITLPIVAMGAGMLKAASAAEETQNKFDVVFSKIGKSANKVADELSGSFGLSKRESKALLSSTGDLLTGFGFTQKAALDLSGQVQRLAADLGSLNDLPTEQASIALTKALLGENESVKTLGISILEKDVKAKIKALEASGKFTDETDRQKKVLATLQIAIEQSGNAIGDYARSQDSVANKTRDLFARLDDLAVVFGKIMLPVLSKVITAFSILIAFISKLPGPVKKALIIFAALASVLGPIIFIAGSIATAIGALITVLPILSAVLSGTLVPAVGALATAFLATGIPQVIIGVTALVVLLALLSKNFKSIKAAAISFLKPILGFIDRMIDKLTSISPILGDIAKGFRDGIMDAIRFAIRGLDFLTDKVNEFFDAINPFADAAPDEKGSASAAAGGGGGVAAAAAINNNSTSINIGIQQDSAGNIKGTTVQSTNTASRVRVINKGPMVPVAGF